MARNLCTSQCCGYIVRLSDLRGKPVEFRQYSNYSPKMGVRWDCPVCGEAYFAFIHQHQHGEEETFVIDLSHWETYNDEPCYNPDQKQRILDGTEKPWYLCEHNAEDLQELWGCEGLY